MYKTGTLNFEDFLNTRLTNQRKRQFWVAIDGANNRQRANTSTSAHIYERMSSRGKAFDTREWYMGYLMDAFSMDDGAKCRTSQNIYGIEIDKQYFLYVGLITDLDQLPMEPKTIQKAKEAAHIQAVQPTLSSVFDEPVDPKPHDTPLHKLFPILVGYTKLDGLITGLYFIEQSGKICANIQQLEDSSSFVEDTPEPETVLIPSKTTFVLKSQE